MKKEISNNISRQIGFGLTAAALIGSYCVCACAALGQGLFAVLFCCIICIFSSLKLKNNVFSPDAFLLVPMFYIFTISSQISASISVLLGSFIFIGFRKLLKNRKIPDYVITGAAFGLAIAATILLTNHYFGIGSTGETPLQMLKSYRSLGFHPNFRGLLYGTITLFTMITYPFKFRKLNRYIPAAFITVLIPFVLNLFLNPEKELTTINEATFLSVTDTFKNLSSYSPVFSIDELPIIIKNSVALGVILLGYSSNENTKENNLFFCANALSGTFSGLPVRKINIRGYGIISAVTAFMVITSAILLFPDLFSRLPMHCIGSMLIVSAWQSVPYRSVSEIFKRKSLSGFFALIVCAVAFIIFDIFSAVLICIAVTVFCTQKTPFSGERSGTSEN